MDVKTREKISGEIHYRGEKINRSKIDPDKRTAELSFSSETIVPRWWGLELLSHEAGAMRTDRMNAGGALLLEHEPEDLMGKVEECRCDTVSRRGLALVRFSRSVEASEVFQDVVDGIRENVSVGYIVHAWRALTPDEMTDEQKTMAIEYAMDIDLVTDWEPVEISLVSIPADVSVGVGRKINHTNNQQERDFKMAETITAPAIDEKQIRLQATQEEQTRVGNIYSLASRHEGKVANLSELRDQAIREGWNQDRFGRELLDKLSTSKPIDTTADGEGVSKIGMRKEDLKRYSLSRAILGASTGKLDGIELEMSREMEKFTRRSMSSNGFIIPEDVYTEKRALTTMDSTKGGYLVGTEVLGGSMIEFLYNKMFLGVLGARSLSGLTGNVAIPRVTGGATAYWLNPNAAVTATDQAFGQMLLTPKRLIAQTAYDKELVAQASVSVESFVREEIMMRLAIAKDLAGIAGLGANGQPLGIISTTGVKTVTFGAAATWAKVVDFETQIATANADSGSLGYLTTPATRGKWKGAPKVAGYPVFLWDSAGMPPGVGMVNGYKAYATNQVPSDKVIFGNFADLIMADWAGIDVVVDPYSSAGNSQIKVTITLWTDIGVRHAVSFAVSTDSGAQ